MLFKISKSFVGKMFLIIAVFIGMMAVMVFYCNLYAMWAIRERGRIRICPWGSIILRIWIRSCMR